MEILNIEVHEPVIVTPKFDIISPDGFSIHREDIYYSIDEAKIAFNKWKDGYVKQGYYSSVKYGRIPLCDLEDYCELVEVK